jgi:hypothetical protein
LPGRPETGLFGRWSYLDAVAGADFTLRQHAGVNPTPPRVKFLRDSNESSVDKRSFDRFAGNRKRGNLENDIPAHFELRSGDYLVPIDAFDGDVLASSADIDRVPLVLECSNPFE